MMTGKEMTSWLSLVYLLLLLTGLYIFLPAK